MSKNPQVIDHSFSTFVMGLSVGVLGAFLFGTEEGRRIVKETLDAIPESWKKISPTQPKESISDFAPPLAEPMSTPHHLVQNRFEAPPPPPPSLRGTRPDYLNRESR